MKSGSYVSNRARCKELADWLQAKDLHSVSDEDMDLLDYFLAKITDGLPILTPESLSIYGSASYMVGYKKGYEVKGLEVLVSK